MINQEWKKSIAEVQTSLEQQKLKNVFELLTYLVTLLQDWQIREKLDELEGIYKTMLNYMQEGVKDPARDTIYHDLLRSLYKLTDTVLLKFQTKNFSGYYFEKKRIQQAVHEDKSEELVLYMEDIAGKMALNSLLDETENKNTNAILEEESEAITIKLFHHIWLSDRWDTEEKNIIAGLLNNNIYPVTTQSVVISALILNLQVFFDENKILLLLEAYEHPNPEISQRALTGILLFLQKYDKRLYLYPEINNRLAHLAEDSTFKTNVRNIILQFIQSKDTEKITKKITEELLPEMMKINPILSKKIKLEDLISETGFDEKNPEWQNMLEEAGLNSKLQEFSELQMEGADVMHSSFAHLKTYPFFNEISNWFLPFTSKHSVFNDDYKNGELEKMLSTLMNAGFLCNSDKYSLYLSIIQMPESYRKMVISQFSSESAAIEEIQKEELPGQIKHTTQVSNQYIRDLYRFYKVHPQKADFEDIFEVKTNFYQTESIGRLISDYESLMTIGEYYFQRNHFREASEIFDKLLLADSNNDILYQKKGYCMQMTGNLEMALEAYLKAELLNASNSWTIKKMAYCYRILKRPEDALFYYRKMEQLNPDNMTTQLNIGHCFLELKNYTEALKCYFKVEYLDKEGSKAWRPIAWCSFLTGKYEQANAYFEKILASGKPDAADYLNSGHAQLAMENIKKAIEYYRLSVLNYENSIEKFTEAFNNDMEDLLNAGIPSKDIPLIMDQLFYQLKVEN